MSVTGPSYNINAIKKLSELELERGIVGAGSWHDTYKESCYIFIGGLPFGLNEGDIAIVFSQWGEVIDVHLVRDKKTGASKGFAFVGYEDQRSSILAVDNFNSYDLLGRQIRVDHCQSFRAPKKSPAADGTTKVEEEEYQPTGSEGQGVKSYGVTKAMQNLIAAPQSSQKPKGVTHEEILVRDADAEWAKKFEKMLKKERKMERRKKKCKSSEQKNAVGPAEKEQRDDEVDHTKETRKKPRISSLER